MSSLRRFSSSVHTILDTHFCRMNLITGKFFPLGWGDLRAISFDNDLSCLQQWPPVGVKIDWKEVARGVDDGHGFKLFEGVFRTPCTKGMYDALPPESRSGRVQLMVPDPSSGRKSAGRQQHNSDLGGAPACAIHLAATGDQGFKRRLKLGQPLLRQGVATMVHESPYYGSRKPLAQRGSKLLRVSDLFVLGYATIYESVNLLSYLTQEGYAEGGLCMTGLSMGGVHASMSAALYPRPVACAPLMSPRSAAVAYADGALAAALAWSPLLQEVDEKGADVSKVIDAASQAVSWMGSANYVLKELETEVSAISSSRSASSSPNSSSSTPINSGKINSIISKLQQHLRQTLPPALKSQQGSIEQLADELSQDSDAMQAGLSGSTEATRMRLKNVLETFTDISRFPVPQQPQAAVLVAAENDGYVSLESVRELHRHWEGSELRVVKGGHVSAFLMHQNKFRDAIYDSICRLHLPNPSHQASSSCVS